MAQQRITGRLIAAPTGKKLTDSERNNARALAILNGVTFGLGDEIAALIDTQMYGGSYDENFKKANKLLTRYRAENPGEDFALEFVAGIPSGGAIGRGFAALGKVGRTGAGSLRHRHTRTLMAGSAAGAVGGFNEGGTIEERINNAKWGLGLGGAVGLAAPTVASAVQGIPAPAIRAAQNAYRKARGKAPITARERAEAYAAEQMLRDQPTIKRPTSDFHNRENIDPEDLSRVLGVSPRDVPSTIKALSTKNNPISRWDAMRSSVNNPGRANVSMGEAFGKETTEATRVIGLTEGGGSGRAARFFGQRESGAAKRLQVGTDRQFLARRHERRKIEHLTAGNEKKRQRYWDKAQGQTVGTRGLNNVVRDPKVSKTLEKYGINYTGGKTTVSDLVHTRQQLAEALEKTTDPVERGHLQQTLKQVDKTLDTNPWYKKWNDSATDDQLMRAYEAGLNGDTTAIRQLRKLGTPAERQAAMIGVMDRTRQTYHGAGSAGKSPVLAAFGPGTDTLKHISMLSDTPEDYNQFLRVVYTEAEFNKNFRGIYGSGKGTQRAIKERDYTALPAAGRANEGMFNKFYRWWQVYSRGLSKPVRSELSKLLLPRNEHQFSQILGRTLLNPVARSRAERKLILDLMLELGIASSGAAATQREYDNGDDGTN